MGKIRSSEFIVCACPFCGRIQVIENRVGVQKKVFKCRFCNKSRKLKKRSEWGLSLKVLGASTSAKEMGDLVRKLSSNDKILSFRQYGKMVH